MHLRLLVKSSKKGKTVYQGAVCDVRTYVDTRIHFKIYKSVRKMEY